MINLIRFYIYYLNVKAYEEDIVIEKMIEETKATASKINNPDDPRRSAANSARTTPTNNKYNKNL